MGRLPRVTGRILVRALGKAGFAVVRVNGSHHFLQHSDGRAMVVPINSGETIGLVLLVKILSDCELSRDELSDWL
jgi:predicted RNA binding protein YcfA (HicA-like mRNA interferase family)